jgi:menaquinone-dependent protoporphyrinogen IX oxidase
MSTISIVYDTKYGQTQRIAEEGTKAANELVDRWLV